MKIIKSLVVCSLLVSGVYAENVRISECEDTYKTNNNGEHGKYTLNWSDKWSKPFNHTLETNTAYDYLSCEYKKNHPFIHGAVDILSTSKPCDNDNDMEKVFSIGDGEVIKITRKPTTWDSTVKVKDRKCSTDKRNMSVIYIKYKTENNEEFLVLYGHVYARSDLKEGDKVFGGQYIGNVRVYASPVHIHFTITTDTSFNTNGFGRAYKHFQHPTQYLNENSPFSNISKKNLCEKKNNSIRNNSIPHEWGNTGIFLQDCENDKTPKESAIFYNNENYFLVEQGFWEKYVKDDFGISFLGRPTSNPLSKEAKKANGGEDCQSFEKGLLYWEDNRAKAIYGKNLTCDNGEYKQYKSDIPYIDVTADDWFYDYVKDLFERGALTIDKTKFLPDTPISKAEFLKIACKLNGFQKVSYKLNFDDVGKDDWFYDYVMFASSKGWIDIEKTSFKPNKKISRAEASQIVVNILKIYKCESTINFSDVSENDWYFNPICILNEKEIVKGYDNNTFKPTKKIHRASASKILSLAFPKDKK